MHRSGSKERCACRSWRHGSQHAGGKCIVCSQLTTLSTACPSPTVSDDTHSSPDQSSDTDEEFDASDESRSSSLLSASSNGCRRQDSDELSASSSSSAEECAEMVKSRQHDSSQCNSDDAVDATSHASQKSSSKDCKLSLLNSEGSILGNIGCNPKNNACQPKAVSCRGQTTCRCCLLNDIPKQSPTKHRAATSRQKCCASSIHDSRQQCGVAVDTTRELEDTTQVCLSDARLHSTAQGSISDSRAQCLMTNATESDLINSSRVIVLDQEDWTNVRNYLQSKQTQDNNAQPKVIQSQSTEQPTATVDSSVSVSQFSNSENISTSVKKRFNKKDDNECAKKKSKKAKKVPHSKGDTYCSCGGNCRLHCPDDIASHEYCLSKKDERKLKNENTTGDCHRRITFETQLTPCSGQTSRQCCLLNTIPNQSPTKRHTTTAHQKCRASSIHDSRQQPGIAADTSHELEDSMQMSSSDASLYSTALGSTPDNSSRSVKTNGSQSDVIDPGRVIVLDKEDWISVCKYLHSKQTRDNTQPEVIQSQSTEQPASMVDSSIPISQVSNSENISTSVKKRFNEKDDKICAEKKSKSAKKVPHSKDDTYCSCGGNCRLHCADDIASHEYCLSKKDERKWKNENTTGDCHCILTFETQSTPCSGQTSRQCCLLSTIPDQSPSKHQTTTAHQKCRASSIHDSRQQPGVAASTDHESDDSKQVSPSDDRLHNTGQGSTPDSSTQSLKANASQSDVIDPGKVIVLDKEDWISVCKYLRSKQTQDDNAQPEVIQSQSTMVDSNIPISQVSSSENISTSAKKKSSEKDDDLYAEEKSKRANKLLRGKDDAYCSCGDKCRLLQCPDDIASRVYCLSNDDNRKLKNEKTARDCRRITLETRSTPSKGEVDCSLSERSVTISDNDATHTALPALTDCCNQKSVSDDCHRESTVKKSRGNQGIPNNEALCADCHCNSYGHQRTTKDKVSTCSELTDESEFSVDGDSQDEEQLSLTDDNRDTACDKTVTKESKTTTSPRSDATSRSKRPKMRTREASGEAGRRKCSAADKDAAAASKARDVNHDKGNNACRVGTRRCVDCRVSFSCADSHTTATPSASCSSRSSSDTESVDDNNDKTCSAIGGCYEVSGTYIFFSQEYAKSRFSSHHKHC